MENSGRLFNCAACHIQVVICTCCDRGNIYCSSCSQTVRTANLREASKRYQNTFQGKCKHAERQKRYRQRQRKIVTHHGSPDLSLHVVLNDEINRQSNVKNKSFDKQLACHFCDAKCSPYLRFTFRQKFIRDEKIFSSLLRSGP